LKICDGKAVFPNGASLIRNLVITFEQAHPYDCGDSDCRSDSPSDSSCGSPCNSSSGSPIAPQRLSSNCNDMNLVREWRRYANMLVSIGPMSM
jgi:hypothetical protein